MALKESGILKIQNWVKQLGVEETALKLVDVWLSKKIGGMTSSSFPDTITLANGLEIIKKRLASGKYDMAFNEAGKTANKIIKENGGLGESTIKEDNPNISESKDKKDLEKELGDLSTAFKNKLLTTNEYQDSYHSISKKIKNLDKPSVKESIVEDISFYDNLNVKQAIEKATIDYNHAIKSNNEGLANKISANLKTYLESQNYNWKQDPLALEILGEFLGESSLVEFKSMVKNLIKEGYDDYSADGLEDAQAEDSYAEMAISLYNIGYELYKIGRVEEANKYREEALSYTNQHVGHDDMPEYR